jgi:hypothetical protein
MIYFIVKIILPPPPPFFSRNVVPPFSVNISDKVEFLTFLDDLGQGDVFLMNTNYPLDTCDF